VRIVVVMQRSDLTLDGRPSGRLPALCTSARLATLWTAVGGGGRSPPAGSTRADFTRRGVEKKTADGGYRCVMDARRCAQRSALRAAALTVAALLTSTACGSAPADVAAPAEAVEAAEVATAHTGSPESSGDPGASLSTEAEGSEVGTLVAGFPVDLLPVPEDAMILVTSAVPVGDAQVREISLNLRTRLSVEELVTLYSGALESAGFALVEPVVSPEDLAAEVTFTRSGGDELVSIGILDTEGARSVTIGGRVRDATD
jgi:hypothetical protein